MKLKHALSTSLSALLGALAIATTTVPAAACSRVLYTGNPMKNPRSADEWEPYLRDKQDEQARLTRALGNAEAELNDRVYHLFELTADEIKLLQQEVEH